MVRSGGKAVALLSGGLDSVVATTAAVRTGEVALAVTFDYGQRSREREAVAARSVARSLGVKWRYIKLPWLAELLPEGMRRAGRRLPRPRMSKLDDAARMKRAARALWVPNRNGVFLNIAAAYAEALGARSVVAGFNREEAQAFPDNSPVFMKRATAAMALSTLSRVRVVSPTAKLTKSGVVRLGVKLRAPMRFVWSCYGGGSRMCGECESCARLLRALREARSPKEFWPRALAADR